MKKNTVLILATLAIVVLVFVLGSRFYESQDSGPSAVHKNQELLIRSHSQSLGPADAPVVVVEFFDPECESCRAMHPIVKHVLGEFEGKVRLVLRYMPFHGNSMFAATALEVAKEKGKYWEALGLLFETQPEWAQHHAPRPELIPEFLKRIGIEPSEVESAFKTQKYHRLIEQDRADGVALGVRGTPTFFINGEELLELGYEPLRRKIEEKLSHP